MTYKILFLFIISLIGVLLLTFDSSISLLKAQIFPQDPLNPIPVMSAQTKEKAIKYSKAIEEEARAQDLVRQIKRATYYAQSKGLMPSKTLLQLEKLENLLQQMGEELELERLRAEKTSSLPPQPHLPGQPPFQPPSPVESQPQFPSNFPPGAPPKAVDEGFYDFDKIDYKKIDSLSEQIQELSAKSLSSFFKEAGIKSLGYSNRITGKKLSGIDKKNLLKSILFGVRIEDYGGRFYGGEGWELIKPFNFDFANAHEQNYGNMNPIKGIYDFDKLDRAIEWHKTHSLGTSIEFSSYVSSWLREKYGESLRFNAPVSSQLFYHNAFGKAEQSNESNKKTNIWHAEARNNLMALIGAVAKHIKNNPDVFLVEFENEPALVADQRLPAGYSQVAKKAYKRYLMNKYKEIKKLNEKWRTSFSSFEEIGPPKNLSPAGSEAITPQIYEFEKFRRESLKDYFAELISRFRKTNPNHIICSQFLGFLNTQIISPGAPDVQVGLDFYNLSSLPWDIYGSHDMVFGALDGDGRRADVPSIYSYSINRYAKHILWNDEFWWPEWEAQNTTDELKIRAVAERNIWRQIAWGKRGLIFFSLDVPSMNWNNSLLNQPKNQIMRYSSGIIPVVKEKIKGLEKILFDLEITNQKIAILQPSASIIVATPQHYSRDVAVRAAERFWAENYTPFFIPEEAIMEGKENLKDFKLLIVPYATHTPTGLSSRLIDWVKKGGILVSIGPLGVYDEYGEYTNNFIKSVFGIEKVAYQKIQPNFLGQGFPGIGTQKIDLEWRIGDQGEKTLEKDLGQGEVIMGPKAQSEELINLALKKAAPLRLIDSDITPKIEPFKIVKDIELVLLNDTKGARYLFVINLNIERPLNTNISIKGVYKKIADLSFKGGILVPAKNDEGWTNFKVQLEPGEGILYKLEKS